jgi:hypothetical protein
LHHGYAGPRCNRRPTALPAPSRERGADEIETDEETRQDDQEVRREYADPSRFAARAALWSRRTGPRAFDVAFDAIVSFAPRCALEVGCDRGEATIGRDQLQEMWELVGRDVGERRELFMRENGARLLRKHFDHVTMVDLPATVEMIADDMRRYSANSVAHRDLAARVPEFAGTVAVTASTAVFIAQ